MPLVQRSKDACLVAMGEGAHGTREFQQIKVRMFRFLLEKFGFTVFGIEANWPESLTVNAYVNGAEVDPAPGLWFDWWKTSDALTLLRWMREYNRDPAHTRKLKFYDQFASGTFSADRLRSCQPDRSPGAIPYSGVDIWLPPYATEGVTLNVTATMCPIGPAPRRASRSGPCVLQHHVVE